MRLRLGQLADFAAGLDLDLSRTPVCLACLSFVSAGLREGDERDARSWARQMTPFIWEEGLAEPALQAVREACRDGVRQAEAALADLEARGGRSVVARAIVLRLAAELAEEERRMRELHRRSRHRLAAAPPEWN
jgi:hypothetical protein